MAAENGFTSRASAPDFALTTVFAHSLSAADRGDANDLPVQPLSIMSGTQWQGELVFTLSRTTNIAPRIRYSIHDRGHVLRYPQLVKILKQNNLWHEFDAVKISSWNCHGHVSTAGRYVHPNITVPKSRRTASAKFSMEQRPGAQTPKASA